MRDEKAQFGGYITGGVHQILKTTSLSLTHCTAGSQPPKRNCNRKKQQITNYVLVKFFGRHVKFSVNRELEIIGIVLPRLRPGPAPPATRRPAAAATAAGATDYENSDLPSRFIAGVRRRRY
jgi:hypothetical protein